MVDDGPFPSFSGSRIRRLLKGLRLSLEPPAPSSRDELSRAIRLSQALLLRLLYVVALPASRPYYRLVPCVCSRICPAACTRQCFVHAYTAGTLAIRPMMPRGNHFWRAANAKEETALPEGVHLEIIAWCSLEDFETSRLARRRVPDLLNGRCPVHCIERRVSPLSVFRR